MQLESYISDLLYRYECVTVPDFGAFLSQRSSATIHESTHAFYPPKKILSFNEQIKTNDGLLAHYIADVEKIPFEEASEKIQKRVASLKLALAEGQKLTFDNIGDLSLNTSQKISFEPSYHLNYLTDAFGLSQFVSPQVVREIYKDNVEEIERVIPIAITPEKRKSKSYLKYAAVALLALSIGGFGVSNYYVNGIEAHNQIAQEEANTQLENKIQEATFVINNPLPAVTLNLEKVSGNYHVIAGAFRVEENSNKKVAQLKAEGFQARKIGRNAYGLHQVAYSSHVSRAEALETLRSIRGTNNTEAWLLVKAID